MSAVDVNDLAYWFPKIKAAGLPVPATEIVHTDLPLLNLLDGALVRGFEDFLIDLLDAADKVRYGAGPFFLRTGHTSGKHSWRHTCFVSSHHSLGDHVYRLVETSALADMMGLPTDTWVVRELLPTKGLFTLPGFGHMPVVREFRFFATPERIAHVQPYWPPDAVKQGDPTDPHWEGKLDAASRLDDDERGTLARMALAAAKACDGYWSIDFLQDHDGRWWLTDMADGERSFRWDPESET